MIIVSVDSSLQTQQKLVGTVSTGRKAIGVIESLSDVPLDVRAHSPISHKSSPAWALVIAVVSHCGAISDAKSLT